MIRAYHTSRASLAVDDKSRLDFLLDVDDFEKEKNVRFFVSGRKLKVLVHSDPRVALMSAVQFGHTCLASKPS